MQRSKKQSTPKGVVASGGGVTKPSTGTQSQQHKQQQQNQVQSNPPIQLKPTDQTIPPSLKQHFPEKVELYEQLQSRERLLDMMINRKLLDLQDHQQRISTTELSGDGNDETLRIFIYNTSENQLWQKEEISTNTQSDQSLSPMWTLRIEGRLLNDKTPLDDPNRHKMSWFLSGLSIELKAADGQDETNPLIIKGINAPGASGNSDSLIEWHDDIKLPEAERKAKQFDGMDIKRGGMSIPNGEGDEREIIANIVIQPKIFPITLMITDKSLMELVGAKEITQTECIKRIFWYAKINQLFEVQTSDSDIKDSTDSGKSKGKKIITIKSDELLMKIFGLPYLTMPQIMEIVGNKLLKPVEPIRIKYHINTLKNTTLGDVIIDIKVNKSMLEERKVSLSELNDINKLITEDVLNKQSIADLIKLDENLKLNMQILNYSKTKYDFYKKFSENPAEFLKQVIQKNDEYLKILSSDSMSFGKDGLVSEELVRKSDFYTDDFLKQHINLLLNSGRI
jgi:SWI/SNF complex component SWP73